MDRNYGVITSFSKYFYFQKTWSNNFADIIKMATMFIKTTFKDS